ncbi:MAG TPA: hypothetical protein VGE74_01530, partial [Gemmata sp.]
GPTSTGCGWAAGLTAADCLSVRVLSAAGRCACDDTDTDAAVPLTSTDGLTWTSPSADPDPDPDPDPGTGNVTTCTECPDGAARTWTVLTGAGSGDWSGAPTTWAPVYTSGCQWDWMSGDGLWAARLTVTATYAQLLLYSVTDGSVLAIYRTSSAPSSCCGILTMTLFGSLGSTPPTLTSVGGTCEASVGEEQP